MNLLFQRHLHCTARRMDAHTFLVETHYLDPDLEAVAGLWVDSSSFIIKKGQIETYRSGDGNYQYHLREIPGLNGVSAYFGTGKELKEALVGLDKIGRDLFAEGVRGAIQAETFLLKERGFHSAGSYQQYWETVQLNTCRYYSNLGRVKRKWSEYVRDRQRQNILFNRYKTIGLYKIDNCAYHVYGSFSDSYHELGLDMTISAGDFRIKNVDCRLLRAPDAVCFESPGLTAGLENFSVRPRPSKKDIAAVVGGSQGCAHVVDLVFDAVDTIDYVSERLKKCAQSP